MKEILVIDNEFEEFYEDSIYFAETTPFITLFGKEISLPFGKEWICVHAPKTEYNGRKAEEKM